MVCRKTFPTKNNQVRLHVAEVYQNYMKSLLFILEDIDESSIIKATFIPSSSEVPNHNQSKKLPAQMENYIPLNGDTTQSEKYQSQSKQKVPELNESEYYISNIPEPVGIEEDENGFMKGIKIQKRNVHSPTITFNVSSEDNVQQQNKVKTEEHLESNDNPSLVDYARTDDKLSHKRKLGHNGKIIVEVENSTTRRIISNSSTDKELAAQNKKDGQPKAQESAPETIVLNRQNDAISAKHDFQPTDQQKEVNYKSSISNPNKINSPNTQSVDEAITDPFRHPSDLVQIKQNSKELFKKAYQKSVPNFEFIEVENSPKTRQSHDPTEQKPKVASQNVKENDVDKRDGFEIPNIDKNSVLVNIDTLQKNPESILIKERQSDESQKSNHVPDDLYISDKKNIDSEDASPKIRGEPIDLKHSNEDPNSNDDKLIRQEVIETQKLENKSSQTTAKEPESLPKRTQMEQNKVIKAGHNDPMKLLEPVKLQDKTELLASKVTDKNDKESKVATKPNVKLEPEPESRRNIQQTDAEKLISQPKDGKATDTSADVDDKQESLVIENNVGNPHQKTNDKTLLLPSNVNDNKESAQDQNHQSKDVSPKVLNDKADKPIISQPEAHESKDIDPNEKNISEKLSNPALNPNEQPSSHDVTKIIHDSSPKDSKLDGNKNIEQKPQIYDPEKGSSGTTKQDHSNIAIKTDTILLPTYDNTKKHLPAAKISGIPNTVANNNAPDAIPPLPQYDKIGGSLEIMNEYAEDNANIQSPVRKSTLEYSTELLDDAFFSEKKGSSPAGQRKSFETSAITSSNHSTNGTPSSVNVDTLPAHSAITTVPNYIMSVNRQTNPKSDSLESESVLKSCTCYKDEPNTIEINLSRPCRLVINVN